MGRVDPSQAGNCGLFKTTAFIGHKYHQHAFRFRSSDDDECRTNTTATCRFQSSRKDALLGLRMDSEWIGVTTGGAQD